MKIFKDITTIEGVKYHRPVWYNEVSAGRISFTKKHPVGNVVGYFNEVGTLHIFDVEEPQGIITTYAFIPVQSKFVEEPCPDSFSNEGFLGCYLIEYGL